MRWHAAPGSELPTGAGGGDYSQDQWFTETPNEADRIDYAV
jgi:hypothetical protein